MSLKEEYENLLETIYSYVTANMEVLAAQEICTCLHCKEDFSYSEIDTWIKDNDGLTAICPKCGIDAVVPYEIPDTRIVLDKDIKDDLQKRYF